MIFRALIFLVLLLPATASAATLSFEREANPSSNTIMVVLSSNVSLNAVELRILLPHGLHAANIKQGPLVPYAIESPILDEEGAIVFSGIIPGGWSGTNGVLLSFSVEGQASAPITFDSAQTHGYRNDGLGTQEPLTLGTISPAQNLWSGPLVPLIPAFFILMLLSLLAYRVVERTHPHAPVLQ